MPLIAGSSLDQGGNGGGVRTVLVHRDGDHLDPIGVQHREVPVIAGDRADELDGLLADPRPRGVDAAMEQEHQQGVASSSGSNCRPR